MTSRRRTEATPVVAAAQLLVAPQLVRSVEFRKLAVGAHDLTGVRADVLAFKRAYERALWEAGIPLYACELGTWRVCYARFPVDELNEWEAKVVLELGRAVSRSSVKSAVEPIADAPGWWASVAFPGWSDPAGERPD